MLCHDRSETLNCCKRTRSITLANGGTSGCGEMLFWNFTLLDWQVLSTDKCI